MDKYLYGAQMGIQFALAEKVQLKLAAAYFDFDNIEGRLSTPFVPLSELDVGDTDESRPAFAQRGNTYFPIRRIIPTADNAMGTTRQFQYYGLATPFKDLDLNARIDIDIWEPYRLSFVANYVQNLAWDGDAIDRLAVNNRGPDPDGTGPLLGNYEGEIRRSSCEWSLAKPSCKTVGTGSPLWIIATWSPTPCRMPSWTTASMVAV